MKTLFFSLIMTLSSFLSFSQKNVNIFATDFYDFTMTIDELMYFMSTDSTMNRWSYMESYESDYFMVFNINFKENNVISSVDEGDTLNNYQIISKNILNNKNIYLSVSDSNGKSQMVVIYKNNEPYRFMIYHIDGTYAIGYISKNVSLQ
jgi:hypothetical protein